MAPTSPRKTERNPESLTPGQFSIRLVIVGFVISAFIFLAFFLNHWHLSSQSHRTERIAQSSQSLNPEKQPKNTHPDTPLPPQEKVPLTFYERLSEKTARPEAIDSPLPTPEEKPALAPEATKKEAAPTADVSVAPKKASTPAADAGAVPKKKESEDLEKTTVGNYTIQVGSFQDLKQALNVIGKLKQKGFAPHMVFYPSGGGNWYRVRLGNYTVRGQAEGAAQELKARANVQGLVISLKGP